MPSVTPASVRHRFTALSSTRDAGPAAFDTADSASDFAAWIDAIEVEADTHAGDPRWTELLLDARLLARPVPRVEGWRCERCIRADRFSSTWLARDAEGHTWVLRIADPTPHALRQLARDARALRVCLQGLEVREALIAVRAPGSPLVDTLHSSDSISEQSQQSQRIQLIAATLRALEPWDLPHWGPGRPVAEEVRRTQTGVQLVTLTPDVPGTRTALDAVVRALPPGRSAIEGPIDRFLAGLSALDSPETPEVESLLKRALAESLGERAVELRQRHLQTRQDSRRERLQQMLERLFTALDPPTGEGPIGFDLDGNTTRVVSDGRIIRWGAATVDDVIYTEAGFDAPLARRFLRACATAPARPEGAGDPATTERINRWVSAGLRLRTLRMLLDRTSA